MGDRAYLYANGPCDLAAKVTGRALPQYRVETSADGRRWTTVARDVTGGRTGFTGLGRHVRITATGCTGPVRLDAATVPGTR